MRILSKKLIICCESQLDVVNPLTVALNKAGKPRLVLDCKHINSHLHKSKSKLQKTCLFLRGAYYHISIKKKTWSYLGFAWHDGKSTRYYVFNVLAFGIATAGHNFSKTVREMLNIGVIWATE